MRSLSPPLPRPRSTLILDGSELKTEALILGGLQELDELASDKGESGLAISLSKPFQRLLKYPLLLQNLLYVCSARLLVLFCP